MMTRMPAVALLTLTALGSLLRADEPKKPEKPAKSLRILVFTSAPTREYQFLRTLLILAKENGWVELAIHIQPPPGEKVPRKGVDQEVDPKRLLEEFPRSLQDPKKDDAETAADNLNHYDLLIAIDPDWKRLSETQLANVNQWVKAGGAMIVVAGPIHTAELAGKGETREKLKPIAALYPVHLQDARLLEKPAEPTAHRLHFPHADEMRFLTLQNGGKGAVNDWEEFFTGETDLEKGKKGEVVRGFYSCYPVESIKETTRVLATFADPKFRMKDGADMPYLAVMPVEKGRVIWLGSGETWRLRQYREGFHEFFWTNLTRQAVKK